MPWERLGPAIGLFTLVTGLCLGCFVGWATLAASTRRASLPRLVAGGALGGAAAGIVPGFLGSAGFGSLAGPYLGSLNILSCALLGATIFVVLWAPRLLPTTQTSHPAQRFALAALSAVITVGAAGLLGGVLASSLHLIPALPSLRCLAHGVGLPLLGIAGGLGLGMLAGALIGLCCGIFLVLADKTSRGSSRRAPRQ